MTMNEFDDKISIVPMATNDKAVVSEFLKTFFFGHEPLVVSAEFFKDVESLERLQNNAFKTLDNGLTFKAVSSNGNLMGVILNEILYKNNENPNNCNYENEEEISNKFEEFMALFQKVEKESDVFGKYPEINRIMNIKIVTVNEVFRNRGVCTALFDKTKQLALENECSMIRVECSNHFSARAAEKLGFQCIHYLRYNEYKNKKGKVIFNPPAPHEFYKVYVLHIKNC